MRTDHPIYLFLSAGPEAFRVLTGGLELVGPYRFTSTTLKSLERRIDGLLEPDGHAGPVYLVEFYGQPVPTCWYNLLTKIGLYGEQQPTRDLVGVGIFLRRRDVPRNPSALLKAPGLVHAIALDEVLPQLLACDAANPYVATLAPLVITDETALRARAPVLWQTVQRARLSDDQRGLLSAVLQFWFFERFRGLPAKEVWKMLNLVTPIQETMAYRSIFAEGKAEGKTEDLVRLLTRRFGPLPDWAAARIAAAPVAQLDQWLDGIFDAATLIDLLGAATAVEAPPSSA